MTPALEEKARESRERAERTIVENREVIRDARQEEARLGRHLARSAATAAKARRVLVKAGLIQPS